MMRVPNALPQSKEEYLSVVAAAGASSLRNAASVLDASLLCYHMEVPIEDAKKYVKTLITKLNARDSFDPEFVKQGRARARKSIMPY